MNAHYLADNTPYNTNLLLKKDHGNGPFFVRAHPAAGECILFWLKMFISRRN
jgi:hypothetical protein